ncbi:MAG TPA: hypothetical protein V6C57_08825 [Coleofasciculaceae cyanobacterium]
MVSTRGKLVSIAEVWCKEETKNKPKADVIYYFLQEKPIEGTQCHEFYTIEIDLTQSEEKLWDDISKNDKYKIRRARDKDGLIYKYFNVIDDDILEEFCDFFNHFAYRKGLKSIKKTRLKTFVESGSLVLSKISSDDGTTLVWHSYYYQESRVHLLQSASARHEANTNFNSMIGRGNRYHHWKDILTFKNLGIPIYDFGGWYAGNTDQERLGINQFKEKFGGEIVKSFNCSYGRTFKGRAYLHLQKILRN